MQKLKSEDRPRVIEAIAEARAHGDLKENAEYHAAREQQGFIEGRIKDIEGKLSHAQVIDVTKLYAGGKVVFGATVDVLDVNTDEEFTYQIVGEDEADIKAGQISVNSPIARALIGKSEGDEAVLDAPGGQRELEILEVPLGDRRLLEQPVALRAVEQRKLGDREVGEWPVGHRQPAAGEPANGTGSPGAAVSQLPFAIRSASTALKISERAAERAKPRSSRRGRSSPANQRSARRRLPCSRPKRCGPKALGTPGIGPISGLPSGA